MSRSATLKEIITSKDWPLMQSVDALSTGVKNAVVYSTTGDLIWNGDLSAGQIIDLAKSLPGTLKALVAAERSADAWMHADYDGMAAAVHFVVAKDAIQLVSARAASLAGSYTPSVATEAGTIAQVRALLPR